MSAKLHSSVKGNGPDVVLLHGLFGSGNNLGALARSLAEHYTVHSLDLPNHGRSQWQVHGDIGAMADSVVQWMSGQGLESASLVGHSLGGKVAMQIALSHPSVVRALVVADIAPVAYPPRHDGVFAALAAVASPPCRSRKEAADRMEAYLSEPGVIPFLLSSLQRSDEGTYQWRFNLAGIREQYPSLSAAPPSAGSYSAPVLFISGGNSGYIKETHREAITSRFPRARLKIMAGCGHWLHAEKPELFNRLVADFLDVESS